MNIVKPENFFYIDEKEIKIREKGKFNLYNFDYPKLISLYLISPGITLDDW